MEYITPFLYLLNTMAPYLLLGFLLAGVIHAYVPRRLYARYLSQPDFRSVALAALFGVPLPLCSCGVIPTAMSLRREGASKGAVTSFLIATPQTGVDSIVATYSVLGLPFAVIRPVVALVTALAGGWTVNRLTRSETDGILPAAEGGEVRRSGSRFVEALRYGFVDMIQDIGRWLVLGLLVAGLITILVPDNFFASFADKPLLNMAVVLLFSIPMYLCATGSIPIAAALMLKGLSPGAALVLLMAGPATNTASILVIGKVLGRRTLTAYLGAIVAGAGLRAGDRLSAAGSVVRPFGGGTCGLPRRGGLFVGGGRVERVALGSAGLCPDETVHSQKKRYEYDQTDLSRRRHELQPLQGQRREESRAAALRHGRRSRSDGGNGGCRGDGGRRRDSEGDRGVGLRVQGARIIASSDRMKGVLRQLPQDAFVLDAVFYSVPAVRFATAESASRRSQTMIYSSSVRFTVRNPSRR